MDYYCRDRPDTDYLPRVRLDVAGRTRVALYPLPDKPALLGVRRTAPSPLSAGSRTTESDNRMTHDPRHRWDGPTLVVGFDCECEVHFPLFKDDGQRNYTSELRACLEHSDMRMRHDRDLIVRRAHLVAARVARESPSWLEPGCG